MLGATASVGQSADNRVCTLPQDAMDVATFLQQGDIWIYAHASYWRETACIAMLEAMACGLPVVVSNAGGIREYLQHGRTGFTCVTSDEFALFARLLLDQPALRQSMSIEARRFVQQYHSLKSLTHRLRTVL